MKKNIAPLLFGIIFLVAGLGYLGTIIFDWNFTIFFDGWWTMFIIIPSFVSILANGPRAFNLAALLVGVLLLLQQQNVLPDRYFGTILVAGGIIYVGLAMIVSFIRKPHKNQNMDYTNYTPYTSTTTQNPTGGETTINVGYVPNDNAAGNSDSQKKTNHWGNVNPDTSETVDYNAILSAIEAKNTSSNLRGGHVTAVMGGVDLDLRDATLTQDITIHVAAIMGGVDIWAPRNARVFVNKTDILGGTDCKNVGMPHDMNVPAINFICTTVMGGIDIK